MPKKRRPALIARDNMTSLGVYKPEFEPIIEIYGQLVEQYNTLTEKYESSGFNYLEHTPTGTKKAPIVTTLEALRKDILAYASQLGLTPQGILKADDAAFKKKRGSKLAAMIDGASK